MVDLSVRRRRRLRRSLVQAAPVAVVVAAVAVIGPTALGRDAAPVSARATSSRPAQAGDAPKNPTSPRASACSLVSPGQRTSCRFTATTTGGWWAGYTRSPGEIPGAPIGVAFSYPSARVLVTRAGETTEYDTIQDAGCDDAVIRPRDLVEVDLTSPASVPERYEVGAGAHWGCDGPSR